MENNQINLFGPPAGKKPPVVNPDGVSLKGCNFIYAPKGQAGEYAALAANPYRGCGHACRYCYVPKVIQTDRASFDQGAVPRKDFMLKLEQEARKYEAAGITEQVMLSFTTDVYNPVDTSLTRPTIRTLQFHGLGVCVLTKGGSRAMADIDLFRPDRDAFATTLTTEDDDFSRKWEPFAALPADRIKTLQSFKKAGIFTWISLEPTLDIVSSLSIVRRTHDFIDLYKIGRANYLPMTATTDWEYYTKMMLDMVNLLNVKHYFKKDLQKYLPEGYPNPLRIPQHN